MDREQARIGRRAFLRSAAWLGAGVTGLTLMSVACAPAPAPSGGAANPTPAPAAKATTPPQPTPASASGAPAAAPTQAAAPAAGAAPTSAPATTGATQDVTIGLGTDAVTLDTRVMTSGPIESQVLHVLDPLLWPDPDGQAKGVLASAWEPVTDPPGWRFKLRTGVRFTNDEPFDAEAVKYTINSILDPANQSWVHPDRRTALGSIQEVKIEDPQTVVLVTKSFTRALPINLYLNPMVPPKLGAEKGKEFGAAAVGTGHYKMVEYRSKSHLRLEPNPQFHGNWGGTPRNTSLTFRYLAENATRMSALEAGEVHVIDNVSPDAVDRLKRNQNLDALITPTTRTDMLLFHCGRPPFNDLNARLAVAHAIDRDALTKKIMGGMTQVANTPFSPNTLGTIGETFAPYEFDLKKAKDYFAKAGLTNGTNIKIGGPIGRYINDKQVMAAVSAMVAEVGFAPELEQGEWGVYWPKFTPGGYDIGYTGWATRGFDPIESIQLYAGWSDDNSGATHFVEENKRVLDLYQRANATPSKEEADRIYKELAHLLWDKVPSFPLFYEPGITGVNKKLRGWEPRPDTYTFFWTAQLT